MEDCYIKYNQLNDKFSFEFEFESFILAKKTMPPKYVKL